MTPDIPGLADAKEGVTSNGVPYVALPPEGYREPRGLVVLWHGADPPRTEEALAAAVPMRELAAWRVYLGMPGHGRRSPRGGVEEIMRLAAQDALTLLFRPRIEGAVSELTGAVNDIRAKLEIDSSLPLGIFGFSQGGAVALLALSRNLLPFKAAVTFGAVIDFAALIDAMARYFGVAYEWTDERRVLATQLSSTDRARAIAESRAAILLGVGAEDPDPTRGPAERLAADIRSEGGIADVKVVPNVGHSFVEEPGETPVPQGPKARAVDALANGWFSRYLQ